MDMHPAHADVDGYHHTREKLISASDARLGGSKKPGAHEKSEP
jgi:hypothetical protein